MLSSSPTFEIGRVSFSVLDGWLLVHGTSNGASETWIRLVDISRVDANPADEGMPTFVHVGDACFTVKHSFTRGADLTKAVHGLLKAIAVAQAIGR